MRYFLSQKKYVGEILNGFQMKDCNHVFVEVECGTKLHKDAMKRRLIAYILNKLLAT